MTKDMWDQIWEAEKLDSDIKLVIEQQRRVTALITNCFPDGATVLDLGSGDGELAEKLKEAGHDVTCVDISQVALKKAAERGFKTLERDLQTIDFREWQPDSYDAVVISHLLDHLTEPQQVVKMATMVLKPKGFMAIAAYRTSPKQKILRTVEFPTRSDLSDDDLIGLLRSTVHGTVRLEKHSDSRLSLCFVGESPTPSLALCLVVWNEGSYLAKCLESVLCDELIIGVDDSSDDIEGSDEKAASAEASWTYKVAKEYVDKVGGNSQVYLFPHMVPGTDSYNFSAIRNEGFDKVESDWIIQIDGHEFLNAEAVKIKNELKWSGERTVYHIMMHRSSQVFHVPHIWLNNRKYGYVNAVHNILAYKDGTTIPIWKRTLMQGVHCYHEWSAEKAEERAEQRDVGNLPGLMKEAEENPKSERPWFFIGNAYLGLEKFEEAYDAYEKCLELALPGQEELVYQCSLLQGKILLHLEKIDEARKKLLGLSAIDPNRNEHYIYSGDSFAVQKEFEAAKRFYLMATHFKVPFSCMFVEEDLYGWFLSNRIFMAYSELGQWDNARTMLIKSIEEMPRREYESQLKDITQNILMLEDRLQQKVA